MTSSARGDILPLMNRRSWLHLLLALVLPFAGLEVQICFCHPHEEHEDHGHGHSSDSSKPTCEHAARAPAAHHRSADHEDPDRLFNSHCRCISFDTGPRDRTKEEQRSFPKKKTVSSSKLFNFSTTHADELRFARFFSSKIAGAEHPPPVPLFVTHCVFLI